MCAGHESSAGCGTYLRLYGVVMGTLSVSESTGALQGQPHLFCPVLNPLLHVFLFSFHSASPRLPDGFTQLLNLTQLFLNDAFLEYLPANFGR